MICGNCEKEALKTKSGFFRGAFYEFCNFCSDIPMRNAYFRDGAGDRIAYPADGRPFYSNALGKTITGKRHFANELRKEGLVQKTGPLSDISMGPKKPRY